MDLNVTFTTEAVQNNNASEPTGFVTPSLFGTGADLIDSATGDAAILKENVISNLTEEGGEAETKQFEQLGAGAPTELGPGASSGGGDTFGGAGGY